MHNLMVVILDNFDEFYLFVVVIAILSCDGRVTTLAMCHCSFDYINVFPKGPMMKAENNFVSAATLAVC